MDSDSLMLMEELEELEAVMHPIISKEALAEVQAAGAIHQVEQLQEVIVAEVRNSTVMVMAAAAAPTTPAQIRSTKAESTKATGV